MLLLIDYPAPLRPKDNEKDYAGAVGIPQEGRKEEKGATEPGRQSSSLVDFSDVINLGQTRNQEQGKKTEREVARRAARKAGRGSTRPAPCCAAT